MISWIKPLITLNNQDEWLSILITRIIIILHVLVNPVKVESRPWIRILRGLRPMYVHWFVDTTVRIRGVIMRCNKALLQLQRDLNPFLVWIGFIFDKKVENYQNWNRLLTSFKWLIHRVKCSLLLITWTYTFYRLLQCIMGLFYPGTYCISSNDCFFLNFLWKCSKNIHLITFKTHLIMNYVDEC